MYESSTKGSTLTLIDCMVESYNFWMGSGKFSGYDIAAVSGTIIHNNEFKIDASFTQCKALFNTTSKCIFFIITGNY